MYLLDQNLTCICWISYSLIVRGKQCNHSQESNQRRLRIEKLQEEKKKKIKKIEEKKDKRKKEGGREM